MDQALDEQGWNLSEAKYDSGAGRQHRYIPLNSLSHM